MGDSPPDMPARSRGPHKGESDSGALYFGRIAVESGMVTEDQVQQCLEIQDQMRALGLRPMKLGDLLLEKEFLSREDARRIFEIQGSRGGHREISGYKIIAKIGEGAMGEVYKAHQTSMDRLVAIKLLAPDLARNKALVERFFREARASAKLNHPNIIQGIDVGESNGVNYFAMEFVDGQTVKDILTRGGAMDERRALRVIAQIADALAHARAQGIIHRDIKPENIMITKTGEAKLCDLGLALIGRDRTGEQQGMILGTPNYISPEQARGENHRLDTRTDIYCLGATLYHMLAGQPAFLGTPQYVIAGHMFRQPRHPRSINALVSPDACLLVEKMMAKNPADRYQRPEQVVQDAKRIMAGQPVDIDAVWLFEELDGTDPTKPAVPDEPPPLPEDQLSGDSTGEYEVEDNDQGGSRRSRKTSRRSRRSGRRRRRR